MVMPRVHKNRVLTPTEINRRSKEKLAKAGRFCKTYYLSEGALEKLNAYRWANKIKSTSLALEELLLKANVKGYKKNSFEVNDE